jgi:hypothetical protein
MPKTILAAAVGETATEVTLNTANPDLSAVRPYIKGLLSWLKSQNRDHPPQPDNTPPRYQIPGDYSIIYRERPVGNLASAFQDNTALQADLWFCMSTSIAPGRGWGRESANATLDDADRCDRFRPVR